MDPFPWLRRRVAHLLRLERYPRRALWLRRILTTWILFHMAAIVLTGVPAPKPLSKNLLERPVIRQELDRWHSRLRDLGYRSSRAAFQRAIVRASKVWWQTRREVLSPLRAYLGLLRLRQGWYMFTAPDVVPARYRVDAGHARSKRGRAPKLEQVFELGRPSGRPDLIPDAFLYDYRMRRALFKASWSDDEAEFERFCDVFEARIVRLDPKTRTVRCRTLRRAVEHPARLGEKRPSHTLRTSLRRVERRALP